MIVEQAQDVRLSETYGCQKHCPTTGSWPSVDRSPRTDSQVAIQFQQTSQTRLF